MIRVVGRSVIVKRISPFGDNLDSAVGKLLPLLCGSSLLRLVEILPATAVGKLLPIFFRNSLLRPGEMDGGKLTPIFFRVRLAIHLVITVGKLLPIFFRSSPLRLAEVAGGKPDPIFFRSRLTAFVIAIIDVLLKAGHRAENGGKREREEGVAELLTEASDPILRDDGRRGGGGGGGEGGARSLVHFDLVRVEDE